MVVHVVLEPVLVRETLTAQRTTVGFLTRMRSHVLIQITFTGEHFGADFALEGLLSGMRPRMGGEVTGLGKSFSTFRAPVGFDSFMI